MSSPLQWGILATGRIAGDFADALEQSPNNRLIACGSRSHASAQAFAERYTAVAAHGNYQALLDDPEVEAIYVATPHPAHAKWTIRALEAGKHVLCEKPLGLSHAEVMAMLAAARRADRFLMEAFMYRCHPQTQALKTLIENGAIGEVRHLQAAFGYHAPFDANSRLFANDLAGGGIMDVGCYPLSMARWLLQQEPLSVQAHGHLGRTGVDEWSAAQLAFDNGVSAHLSTSISVNLDNRLQIFGSQGRIEVANPWLCADAEGRWAFTVKHNGEQEKAQQGQADSLYLVEAEHVFECVRDGLRESPLMSWSDSLGNAAASDLWRRAIGLQFDSERPENHGGPIRGSVRRGSAASKGTATIAQTRFEAVAKPVSRLVMGCDNQPSMTHAAVMWDHYFESGGNAFDTAYIYGDGRMESLLGHWHQARNVREDMVIIGKGAHSPQCFPEVISQQLDESLDRLQSDYVDCYFLHRDNLDVPVAEFVDALNAELERGRIRAFGGSNWTLARIQEANAYAAQCGKVAFSAVSNNFSLAHMVQRIWPGVESATGSDFVDYLAENDIALFPWSSQARGFFTPWVDAVLAAANRPGAALTGTEPTVAELRRTWFSEDNFARRERARTLADETGASMINVALAYVLAQPFLCFPLIGPRAIAETESCIEALGLTLTTEQRDWLAQG
ncbi:MAG: aldo/keto reductase [Pseudomonadales bacterium]